MSKGCNTCAHHKSKWDAPAICAIGKDDQMIQWWQDNGKKLVGTTLTEMDCFQPTEFAIRTQSMIDKVQETLDKLDAIKNVQN